MPVDRALAAVAGKEARCWQVSVMGNQNGTGKLCITVASSCPKNSQFSIYGFIYCSLTATIMYEVCLQLVLYDRIQQGYATHEKSCVVLL